MFEKIPLIRFEWSSPRTPENKQDFPDFSYEINEEARNALKSDFLLDGTQRFIQTHATSQFAMDHFFYLQSFVYLESQAAYFTRRRNYKSFLLLYTYDGAGFLNYEGNDYTLTPGTGFLIDCRRPHYYRTQTNHWTHCDIHFNGVSADYFFQLWNADQNVSFSVSEKKFQPKLEQLLYDYVNFSMERDFLVSNHLESFLLALYYEKKNSQKKEVIPDTIRYLIKYMESNYANELSLNTLSDFSGLSKYHLSREFKRYTGKSPNEYLIELRLHNAKVLLSNTDIPCYKIGEISGIPDFNNFVRLFKKDTGVTPTQFRERL